ncbi:uncharacterized protein [Onthophagus taurus]|uniref:uncharacterized protein n=1 Tax=Onthophagus taurus TaxID=166361 RepID=UPI0039BE2240
MFCYVERIFTRINTVDNHINATRNNIVNEITNFLYKHKKEKHNTSNLQVQICKDVQCFKKFLSNNKDIIVIKSDKTKQLIILYKKQYNEKMSTLLNDKNTYRTIRTDPGPNLVDKINDYLKKLEKLKYIDKNFKLQLAPTHYTTPRIHGLLKIHKDDKPLRPIINNINVPTNQLAKFLNKSLNYLNSLNEYDVKSAWELKEKIKSLNIENLNDIDIVSFDVQSLFINIPLHKMIELVEQNWQHIEEYTLIKNKRLFIEGIKLCTFNNYFTYNETYYRQIFGLPMGSSLSVNLSGIILNHLLDTQLNKTPIKPLLITKYIDDLLIILPKGQYSQLLDVFNDFNDRLKFTVEIPKQSQINFLDMSIIIDNDNNIIRTKWYKKDKSSDRLLNYHSNHPKSQIINTMNNYIYRAIKLTYTPFLKEIKQKIYDILLNNFYPKHLINKSWFTILNNIQRLEVTTNNTTPQDNHQKTGNADAENGKEDMNKKNKPIFRQSLITQFIPR